MHKILQCTQSKSNGKKRAIYKYIWNDESKSKFVNILKSDMMKSQIEKFTNTKFTDSSLASKALENIITFAADQSLKKVKCKGTRNKLFDFTNECMEFRQNFKSVTNQFKKDSANQDKRVKMLIARNRYRREIN